MSHMVAGKLISAGALALSASFFPFALAEAVTELNVAGSASVALIANDLPRAVCSDGFDLPYPTRYSNASNTKVTWTCRLGVGTGFEQVIMRYSTTNSSDGILKVQKPRTDPQSSALFLDHTQTTGCTGPVLVPFPDNPLRKYNKVMDCNDGNTVSLPVDLGSSIVSGSSFHQVGPVGTAVVPLDTNNLSRYDAAVVPYSVFLGKQVVDRNYNIPGQPAAGPVMSLSRTEIENTISRRVTDWRILGKGTTEVPGVLDATSPITLCLQNAGSGLAAAIEALFMQHAKVTSIANPSVIFSPSLSGVVNCLRNNPKSIGILPAHYAEVFTAPGSPYVVGVDDAFALNPSGVSGKQQALECGRYPYWTNWQFYYRDEGDPTGLRTRYMFSARNSYRQFDPYGKYWSAIGLGMAVFKNADPGPLLFTLGTDNTQCSKQ